MQSIANESARGQKRPFIGNFLLLKYYSEDFGTTPLQRRMLKRGSTHPHSTANLQDATAPPPPPPPPLQVGNAVRMKFPGEQKWSLGRCTRILGRRSACTCSGSTYSVLGLGAVLELSVQLSLVSSEASHLNLNFICPFCNFIPILITFNFTQRKT